MRGGPRGRGRCHWRDRGFVSLSRVGSSSNCRENVGEFETGPALQCVRRASEGTRPGVPASQRHVTAVLHGHLLRSLQSRPPIFVVFVKMLGRTGLRNRGPDSETSSRRASEVAHRAPAPPPPPPPQLPAGSAKDCALTGPGGNGFLGLSYGRGRGGSRCAVVPGETAQQGAPSSPSLLPAGAPTADLRALHPHDLLQGLPRGPRGAGPEHPGRRALPHRGPQPSEYARPSHGSAVGQRGGRAPGRDAGGWQPAGKAVHSSRTKPRGHASGSGVN